MGPHPQELCRSILHALEILLFRKTHSSILCIVSHTHSILLFASIFGQGHSRFAVHVFGAVKSNILIGAQFLLVVWVDLFVLRVHIFVNMLGSIIRFERVKLMVEELLLTQIFSDLLQTFDLG